MKSDRRHDLKTNELAEWLSHFPEFWRANYKVIVYITVVLIVVAVAAYFKFYRKRLELAMQRVELTELSSRVAQSKVDAIVGMHQGTDYSNYLLITADALDSLSRLTDDPACTALALNKRAEALRAELHYRARSLEPSAAKVQINQAVRSYEKALEVEKAGVSLKAMAKLGLGLCAEELGESAKARGIYQEIIDNPDYEGTVFVYQARQRLETIDEYAKTVEFTESASAAPSDGEQFGPQNRAEPAKSPVTSSPPLPFEVNEQNW
jgi:tetratricopeptide (TPR) repeat protein